MSRSPTIPVYSLIICALMIGGCSHTAISPGIDSPELPDSWQVMPRNEEASHSEGFLLQPPLVGLINEALANNFQLAGEHHGLEEARLAVSVSGADRYPLIDLNLSGSRQKIVQYGDPQGYSNNVTGTLDGSWELDIWGRLSDRQQQAQLNYQAALARYNRSRQQLAADVATAWSNLMAGTELLSLLEQRLVNLEENLEIIDSGYRRGINEALDVYLTRNTVAAEQSRVAGQRQTVFNQSVALQRLLGRYPDGQWQQQSNLPPLDQPVAPGLPSELLTQRDDIRQAWAQLLSADAGLAVAHKARFPRLTLTASGGTASEALHSLIDEGNLGWSLLGNLSQPLFKGKRLQAEENQALSRVRQAEQAYLDTMYQAMSEAEQAFNNEYQLRQSYDALLAAEQSANAAYDLSFQQYRRGLVSYTTVLESQRRAFDAQTEVIQLRSARVNNRIALHLALGGDNLLTMEPVIAKDQQEQTP